MAEIAYVHEESVTGRRGKYPWKDMRAVGDYFDAPPSAYKGVRGAAHNRRVLTGYIYHSFRLSNGHVRVMLVDIEPGAEVRRG